MDPELNSNQAIKALVEAGLGIAILSERAVQAGRLRTVRMAGLPFERHFSLISKRNATLSSPSQAFRLMLLAEGAPSQAQNF
jgi:LysR family transcriptional regulator, low CO2-responsive transcriptional regulator